MTSKYLDESSYLDELDLLTKSIQNSFDKKFEDKFSYENQSIYFSNAQSIEQETYSFNNSNEDLDEIVIDQLNDLISTSYEGKFNLFLIL